MFLVAAMPRKLHKNMHVSSRIARIEILESAQSGTSHACVRAGLRGMAATRDLDSGEALVSLPVSAALVVTPKARSALPSSFCSGEFFSKKPW